MENERTRMQSGRVTRPPESVVRRRAVAKGASRVASPLRRDKKRRRMDSRLPRQRPNPAGPTLNSFCTFRLEEVTHGVDDSRGNRQTGTESADPAGPTLGSRG